MNQLINLKATALAVRNLIRPATTKCGSVLVVFAVASFALSLTQEAFGVTPAPDGGYPNNNTAEGTNALQSLTTGTDNTAIGFQALFSNTTGFDNTATGSSALLSNTTGNFNTATGESALASNTTGGANTANGEHALISNTTGDGNTANGVDALLFNTSGSGNTANGGSALSFNTTGNNNTATGSGALYGCNGDCFGAAINNNTATGANALFSNNSGNNNTASGANALEFNVTGNNNTATGFNALVNATGSNNTAEGFQALVNSTGSNNIALGANAGINLMNGDNNIYMAASALPTESNTIRIGKGGVQKIAYMQGISGATVAGGVTVIVDTKGHLGTVQSSARFKDEIKPMDKASEAILALKPVTFRYKKELDPDGIPQFGLVAEQVEKVNPALVARDEEGQAYTVRYEAVNAMLLNEFLKAHRKIEEQDHKIQEQDATIVQQGKQIKTLAAAIKEEATQIEKVSAELQVSKPVAQTIVNNQ